VPIVRRNIYKFLVPIRLSRVFRPRQERVFYIGALRQRQQRLYIRSSCVRSPPGRIFQFSRKPQQPEKRLDTVLQNDPI